MAARRDRVKRAVVCQGSNRPQRFGRHLYRKFLAKLASDYRKPNGQYVITPEMGPAFVENLPVGKFHGIGPATSAKMNSLGLHTGLDMRNRSLEFMQTNFGKAGSYYYWISRGVDNREVGADRVRKGAPVVPTDRPRRLAPRGGRRPEGGERRQPCAAFPTLRASQVGSCGAAATSSLKVDGGSFRFSIFNAASAFSGPSQASARTASPAGL